MKTASGIWDPGRVEKSSRWSGLLRLIRLEHTLFSLPFAYAGALLACGLGCISLREVVLIGFAVLGLRTAAMAYNNIADADIDRLNPRTKNRPLVSGTVSFKEAWLLVVLGSLVYYVSAFMLNLYAAILSPLLWFLALSYPHGKRYYSLTHLHLGCVLGLVVFGGAVAAYGDSAKNFIDLLYHVPWVYVIGVSLWVAGFDSFYSVLDFEFDSKYGLKSFAVSLGPHGAFIVSRLLHVFAGAFFVASLAIYSMGLLASLGVAAAIVLFFYQHYVIYKKGVEGIPRAFNINIALGLVVASSIILDYLVSAISG